MNWTKPVTAALTTARGAAEHLQTELQELGIKSTVQGTEWVSCTLTQEQHTKVIRHCLLATRVLALHGHVKNKEGLVLLAKATKPAGSFAVRATGPDRQELQEEIGGTIKESSGATVNLTKPDETYFVLDLDGEYLFGLDLAGEISKRHYKIITGAQSLAGPVAAAILWESGWTPEEDLVVWPCATGELAIEAALRATQKSPRAYELRYHERRDAPAAIVAADPKLAMVSSTQKNAKIAGVHDAIRFSRQDLDWLDTKHDERGVGYFVGLLPNLKLYPHFTKELFYQLDFILANGGIACFCCVNDESAERLEAYVPTAERKYETRRAYVWAGQLAYTLVVLTARGARRATKKTIAPKESPAPASSATKK